MFERHLSLLFKFVIASLMCATTAMSQDNSTSAEILFFGAKPSTQMQFAIDAVAENLAYQANISENNFDLLAASSPEQPLWVGVFGQNINESLSDVISILNDTERTARSTILLEARASNLGWLNTVDISEKISIVISTPIDDLDYFRNLVKPVEEKYAREILLQYNYTALAAATLSQLLEVESGAVPTSEFANWQSGFNRAGFESGLVTLANTTASIEKAELYTLLSNTYDRPTEAHEMFSGAKLLEENNTFDNLLANIALGRDCCSDGSCGWDEEFQALYQFQNIGQIRQLNAVYD